MIAIISIILIVAFIGALKAGITIGLDADITSYATMLSELKVIEVALWFLLAIIGRNVASAANLFNATHDSSVSMRITQEPDGSTSERMVSRWSQTPDFESAKKELKHTLLGFILVTFGLAIFYIVN